MEKINEYVHLIERRGKAIAQGDAIIEKYRDEYDKISQQLKDGYKDFLLYFLSNGEPRKLKQNVIAETCDIAQGRGIFTRLNEALKWGDPYGFMNAALDLHKLYYETEATMR